jgi:cellulose synthase/poly-beta-1,6-N-acetylglucosamine synthase-like glycosyltransferase
MPNKNKNQQLIFLAIFMLVILSYPFISIANKAQLVFNIPILYLYVFIVWITIIFILYGIVEKKQKEDNE